MQRLLLVKEMKVRAILKDEGQRFEDLHSVAWLLQGVG